MSGSGGVLVLGGGAAGLAAAWRLAQEGVSITLIEKRRSPGGKAFSFPGPSPHGGGEIDNGQHIWLGCCTALRGWLEALGTADLAPLEPRARVPFLLPGPGGGPGAGMGWISDSWLPAPFHHLPSLLAYAPLSFSERLTLVRGIDRLRRARPGDLAAWEGISFASLLSSWGQTERIRRRFWDPIVVSACNVLPERASAALAALVFREAMAGGRQGGRFAIPRAGLSALIARPAARAIEKREGRVLTGVRAERLELDGDAVAGVRTADGAFLQARAVISGLAWDDLPGILPPRWREDPFFASARGLAPSPIVGIHLWFDAPVIDLSYAGLLESSLHWVFNQTRLRGLPGQGQYLSLIVSDAADWLHLGTGEALSRAIGELGRFFPEAGTARLEEGVVIKERKATFAPGPGTALCRLPAETPIRGLFLAGAWTQTGWPATLEGAVRSGEAAARKALTAGGIQPL